MKKISKILVLALAFVLLFGTVYSVAYVPYDTYTYSISGKQMLSPTAYSTNTAITSTDMGLTDPEKFGGLPLKNASDIVSDEDGNLYIADTGNNRIVVLDKYYKVIHVIDTYYDQAGRPVSFNGPEGVFVTDDEKAVDKTGHIYVCDTQNQRIVIFSRDFQYERTIEAPSDDDESNKLLNASSFVPNAVAVDIYGRIFVVAKAAYEGIIVLSADGEFTGYIGAQKVTTTVIEMIWKKFQSKEQRATQERKLSIAYNNLTVDDNGFVYATSDKVNAAEQLKALKSKVPDHSPVKKLNSTGHEIMKRNGFFDPGGEVDIFKADEVSKISDIALGPEGTWTILDYTRSRLFTYDQQGNLLFAFGDGGNHNGGQFLGNGENLRAITYQTVGDKTYLIVLDETSDVNTNNKYKISVYAPTDYCDTIINALRNENEHNYDQAIYFWQEVLTKNNNFDLAYIGIGKALFSQGRYKEAYETLQNAYETVYASKAFAEIRKEFINKWILLLAVGLIGLIVALVKFLGYAKKKNTETSLKVGRKTYWEEILYIFHLIFHPFDGFWDLKHEQRGSVRAASTILGATILAVFYNSVGKGYLFNPENKTSTIFVAILSVAVPVILWCVSNWCLTTLFDGEGSFKDIYIATCYALAPLPIFMVISTIMSNVMIATESTMVTLVTVIGFIWAIMLIFFGMLVTHDYSMGKNVITTIGTIVAMAVIMFIIILFASLLIKMVTFVIAITKEISNRM